MPITMPALDPTNNEARCACLLLLDTSSSMVNEPIQSLNEGLKLLETDLKENQLASARVEVGILTFGGAGVNMTTEFTSVADFVAPVLTTSGSTPMAEAIETGLDILKQRTAQYAESGLPTYKPWVFLITDGQPSDMEKWPSALARVHAGMNGDESRKKKPEFIFFAVGVGKDANMELLSSLTPRSLLIDQVKFRDLFLWISDSAKRIAESRPDDHVALAPVGFGAPTKS